ncbi:Cortactin-Binding Protein 2 [Manis pentadactyla]|nr:Cortactin-Binding Protein 2 [Manis pentadactyla]
MVMVRCHTAGQANLSAFLGRQRMSFRIMVRNTDVDDDGGGSLKDARARGDCAIHFIVTVSMMGRNDIRTMLMVFRIGVKLISGRVLDDHRVKAVIDDISGERKIWSMGGVQFQEKSMRKIWLWTEFGQFKSDKFEIVVVKAVIDDISGEREVSGPWVGASFRTERLTNPNPSHDNWTCTFTVTIGITHAHRYPEPQSRTLLFISETSPKSVHKPILPGDLTEHRQSQLLGLDTLPGTDTSSETSHMTIRKLKLNLAIASSHQGQMRSPNVKSMFL